jgi:hypothetical protein
MHVHFVRQPIGPELYIGQFVPHTESRGNGVLMDRSENRHARFLLLRVIGIGLSVFALAGFACVAGLAATAEASTAHSQYAPPPPPPVALPGFTTVLTSRSIGPAGGTIGPDTCDGASFVLTVPAGAFPTTVQITEFCGNLGVLAPAVFAGFTAEAALGVEVQLHGGVYPGTFLKPLTLTSSDAAYTAASVVGLWNGVSLTADPNVTSAPGVVSVSFDTDPDFAFMSPTTTVPKKPPVTVTPVTGKPVLGEGILAGILLVAGTGGLALSRRRIRS